MNRDLPTLLRQAKGDLFHRNVTFAFVLKFWGPDIVKAGIVLSLIDDVMLIDVITRRLHIAV